MTKLSVYLPPFAGDYSGACGVLFGMDCLVIIVDASCCTRNYVEYDETRWRGARKSTFSAQLRTLEATLGDDARLINQTIDAADQLRPRCIALVGTPVPAITGMDLAGIAREVEVACGIPAVGVETTGFETYELGASAAYRLLVDRFATEVAGELPATNSPCVNLFGATVQDYGTPEGIDRVVRAVYAGELKAAWNAAGCYDERDVARAACAQESIVVSQSGLAAARLLRDRFGVPMRVGVPAAALPVQGSEIASLANARPVLIVHDQVIASSLRDAARCAGLSAPAVVASFFTMDQELMEPGDVRIAQEGDLVAFAKAHPHFAWVGDPLLARIPGFAAAPHLDVPHEAVSSTLFL